MKILRIIGIGLLGLGVILGALVAYLYLSIDRRLDATFDIPPVEEIELPADEASLAEGRRLFVTVGCVGCHGVNGAGTVIVDDPAFGYFPSSNLTAGTGGVANDYTSSADWVRTIRHGVRPDGTSLIVMPSEQYGHLTDADVSKIIAYLESLPPVDGNLGQYKFGLLGRAMVASGALPLITAENIDHDTVEPLDVEVGPTEAYGEYLAVRCASCHGPEFDGDWAPPPGEAQPTNITPHETGIGGWTLDAFAKAVQAGVRPDGSTLDPFMPWPYLAQLTDVEVEAIYLYLQSVPPVATEK